MRYWRVAMLWAAALLWLTVSAQADSIDISCGSQAGAGSTVACSVSLSLGADKIDNLTFGVQVTPNGGAPALSAGHMTFSDATGDGGSAPGATASVIAPFYASVSPLLTGTVALGTVRFTVPAAASAGQSYSVAFTGASGDNDTVSPVAVASIGAGPASTVTVSGASLASQTITFAAPANQTLGAAPFTLTATASSALPVSFASNTPAVCTVQGGAVTLVAAGTCSITASQAGSGTYSAAPPVTQSFSVQPANTSPLTITTGATLLSGFTSGAYTQDLTATGGSGAYTWSLAVGAWPAGLAITGAAITGTPTAAGTFPFTLKVTDAAGDTATQPCSLTIVSASGASAPARIGVFSQFAAGGAASVNQNWDMTMFLVNTSSTTAIPIKLIIHSDDGTTVLKNDGGTTPTPTPLTVSQQGDVQTNVTVTEIDRVLNPNTTLTIAAGVGQSVLVQGWVDVYAGPSESSGFGVNGFAIFRRGFAQDLTTSTAGFDLSGPSAANLIPPIEGTVPLQTGLSASTIAMPFDATAANNFFNAVAIGTLLPSGVGANIATATFYDQNGAQIGAPQAIPAPAGCTSLCHTAFALNPGVNTTGTVVFSGPSLIGLGLRGSPYGTLTDVPVILH